jgi:hypothetical protein
MRGRIETGTGYYDQREIKAMSADQLRAVRDWATSAFNEHLGAHVAHDAGGCDRCGYLELLAGACDDLLAKRKGEGR